MARRLAPAPRSSDMSEIFSRLGIALGLGLLVGLQRQRTDARLAGFRTFPLVTLLGALCGLLAETYGGWIVAGGIGGLALIIVGGNLPLLRVSEERPGVTTEVTMLVMFALGAYLMAGATAVAIATCGAVVVLFGFALNSQHSTLNFIVPAEHKFCQGNDKDRGAQAAGR